MKKYNPESKEELQALCSDYDINLGDIDTSKITDMSELFWDSNRDDFSGIETWDVSHVTDMSDMFHGVCLEKIDFSKWNTSSLTNMSSMFNDCSLTDIDLSSFDTSLVENFEACFEDSYFTKNPKISEWDVSRGGNFADMFLDSNFSWNISNWKISTDADTYQMTYDTGIKDKFNPPAYQNRCRFEALTEDLDDDGHVMSELVEKIINKFEHFLDEKGIKFSNPESEDDKLNITDEDYSYIQEAIEKSCESYDLINISEKTVDAFVDILINYDLGDTVTANDIRLLQNKTAATLEKWGFIVPTPLKTVNKSNHR